MTNDEFKDYFFEARESYVPKEDQILSRWRATADFVDGWPKRNVIQMLKVDKTEQAQRVMKNLIHATDKDSVRVLQEMTEDLKTMSIDEVAEKPYRFVVERFFWTKKKYVPDDPHWDIIGVVDLRQNGILNGKEAEDVTMRNVELY